MLLTLQDCHRCQDISVAKACPPFPLPTHTDQQREPRVARVGAGGVLPVPPPGPHLATSGEGKTQELEASGAESRATECRTGEGRRIL